MKLREWYDKEVRVKKMCVECEEVQHLREMSCVKCTCSVFFYLTRLLSPAFIERIAKDKEGLRKDPLPESDKLGAALFEMSKSEYGDF